MSDSGKYIQGFNQKVQLLLGLSVLAIIGTFLLVPAIPQDLAYHHFADQNTYLGVPNFWNVVSNLPFLLIGLAGIREIYWGDPSIMPELRTGYVIFFIGVALVGPGSAYYHLSPDNATLVWDRLPMTIAFMALFAFIIAEYLSVQVARSLLWPLIIIGIVSVFYWDITEAQGHGDLRLYGLVQFLPLVLIPLILFMFRPAFTGEAYLWALLGAYAAAKAAEFLDEPIFNWFYPLSGHTIKHLMAAAGGYFVLLAIRRRTKIEYI